ncbi:hypothetical protein AB6A40_008278 [Gnathostoma spinigerum]|uniref:FAD-binding domain-containing protein n=1 Tax=Gnathostoma spinigerum TaxID=75299 RepID=A0ABD6ENL4_9BILA
MSTLKFDQPDSEDVIAYIIENAAIIHFLLEQIISSLKNVTVKTKSKVQGCDLPKDISELARVRLDDGSEIETFLVIGADGMRSQVRNAMGVKYTAWEYGQKGVVTTLNIESNDGNTTAWQRFTPEGPIALLPLSTTVSSLVWTVSDEHASKLLKISEKEFVDELNENLFTNKSQNAVVNKAVFIADKLMSSVCLGEETIVPTPPRITSLQADTRAAFPLGFGHSHCYIAPRAVLIGDAAHRIHPLGGQGVNLGWGDARALLECLEKTVMDGGDLGSVTYLSDYDTVRQRRNVPVQVVCDWLNRLYRTDIFPLVFMRSLGISALNRLTPLKDFIVYTTSC